MKKLRSKIALCLLLLIPCVALPTFTGCQFPPTKEAVVWYSFKDSWTVAKQAYDVWSERVVTGKATPEAEAKADLAWNKYRASYKVALHVAKGSQQANIPESVLASQTELLSLIKLLSQ